MIINDLNQPIEVERPITIAGAETPETTARIAEFTDSGTVGIGGFAPAGDLHICTLVPPAAVRLIIATEHGMPNRWYRFWQRLLLGWRWEKIDQ